MLDRLYTLLIERTGIHRTRDPRLELIAADRALEAYFQVGVLGTEPITHPFDQLFARVRPLHPSNTTAVYEIAAWHYYAPSQIDPIEAFVDGMVNGGRVGWMNSDQHLHILQDTTLTTWGFGLHRVDGAATTRWYAIGLFSYDLSPLTKRRVAFKAGPHSGVQFTANGQVLGEKDYTLVRDSGASYSVRHTFPGKGPHLYIVDGIWRNYWIPERAESQAVQL